MPVPTEAFFVVMMMSSRLVIVFDERRTHKLPCDLQTRFTAVNCNRGRTTALASERAGCSDSVKKYFVEVPSSQELAKVLHCFHQHLLHSTNVRIQGFMEF